MRSSHLPTLSSKERLILTLLVDSGPKYGLELVDQSGGSLKRGTVYVTLGRMEEKGLVESRHETDPRSSEGLRRRMYHVTAHGRRVLDAWTAVARALAVEPAR
jgi:DNA-binding PadR family transcriptional regulator